jgi:hypothetical protein
MVQHPQLPPGQMDHSDPCACLGALRRCSARARSRSARYSRIVVRRPDLRRADLTGAFLAKARLEKADLRGADLSRADLRSANLSGADLQDAALAGAQLQGACRDPETKLPEGIKIERCPEARSAARAATPLRGGP